MPAIALTESVQTSEMQSTSIRGAHSQPLVIEDKAALTHDQAMATTNEDATPTAPHKTTNIPQPAIPATIVPISQEKGNTSQILPLKILN